MNLPQGWVSISLRAIALCAGVLGLAAMSIHGCATGSSDCGEKATCSGSDDGSTASDVTTSDGGGDGARDATMDSDGVLGDGAGDAAGDAATDDSSSDARADGAGDGGQPEAEAGSVCPSTSTCVDPPSPGWMGPVALFDQTGSPAPQPPPCPSAYPTTAYDGNAGTDSPNAVCTCNCGSASGYACSDLTGAIYQGTIGCWYGNTCSGFTAPNNGTCQWPVCGSYQRYAQVDGAYVDGGSCAPQSTVSKPAPSWSRTGRACATTPTGGCPGSSVCVPVPANPYSGKLCIWRSGDVGCPSGMYSSKITYYGARSDTRGCTTCLCDPPAGNCLGGQVTLTSAYNCGGTTAVIPADGNCHSLPADAGLGYSAYTSSAPVPSGVSCHVSNGAEQPTGSVTETSPTTVCCQP